MAYIQKKVNMVLLLLLALIIASFVGFTYYYENTYKNITLEYTQRLQQLDVLNKNLSAHKVELEEVSSELQQKIEDKKRFDVLYTDIEAERNNLKIELTSTITELKKTQAELTEATEQVKSLSAEVTDLKEEVAEQKIEISNLDEEIDDLNSQLCRYNSTFC